MKNLFKGFVLTMIVFLAFGFDLSAQNDFKTAAESFNIIKAEQATALQSLDAGDPVSAAYAELKLKLEAYNAMLEVLGHEDVSDELVEEAIITGIMAATEGKVTEGDFIEDRITDQEGSMLKDHFETILSK